MTASRLPGPARRALGAVDTRKAGYAAAGTAAAGAVAVAAAKAAAHDSGSQDGSNGTYRLRGAEPVSAGVRRVALGRIDDAVEHLRHGGNPVGAVHEARKDTKKLRSLLRLVRPAIGDDVYRRENDRFRDAARGLSDVRDEQVRLEAFDALIERWEAELGAKPFHSFRASLADGKRRLDPESLRPAMLAAAERIEEGRAEVGGWPLEGADWELIGSGLRRQYGRGRARMADALAEPTTARLHEWRKRSKDHWYHLRLVRNAWREVLGPTADAVHELSDRLGDDHDLALLAEAAAERRDAFGGVDEQSALLSLIDRRRAELQEEAFEAGARAYAEKPKALGRRLRSYWEAWRGTT